MANARVNLFSQKTCMYFKRKGERLREKRANSVNGLWRQSFLSMKPFHQLDRSCIEEQPEVLFAVNDALMEYDCQICLWQCISKATVILKPS